MDKYYALLNLADDKDYAAGQLYDGPNAESLFSKGLLKKEAAPAPVKSDAHKSKGKKKGKK